MKRLILIFMIILITLSTTSCKGSKQEVNNISVVLAMGFDLNSEGKYLFTAQILNPQKSASTKNGSKNVLIFDMLGNTPTDAINKISSKLGKNLFFGHNKYIVIGKELAESGLSLFIDSALRGYETRPDNLLLLTKGKASDIVKAITSDNKIPAYAVEELNREQFTKGYTPSISRLDFANALSSKIESPILGIINLQNSNSSDETFEMEGTAVFKKEKLIGYLDRNQTRGMQWIRGIVKDGSITISLLNKDMVTFEILSSKSNVKSIILDDNITIQISIEEEGNILELTDSINPMENPSEMDKLSKLQDDEIGKEVKVVLDVAQRDLKADIFGFSEIIHRTNPQFWKKISEDWDNIFPNIKIEIQVDSNIKRPGMISKPII